MQSGEQDPAGNSQQPERAVFTANLGKGGKKAKKKGKKVAWSHQENVTLWDSYIRAKIIGERNKTGYSKIFQEIWDGRDISVRSEGSLFMQIKRIKDKNILTLEEREEIEINVKKDLGIMPNNVSDEVEDEQINGDIRENDQGHINEAANVIERGDMDDVIFEICEADLLDRVDYIDDGNDGDNKGKVIFIDDEESNNDCGDGGGDGIGDGDCSRDGGDDDDEVTNDGRNKDSGNANGMDDLVERDVLTIDCEIRIERIDTWKLGDTERAITNDEQKMLCKLRRLIESEEVELLPPLRKSKMLKDKTNQVKGLIHNITKKNMDVTFINRLMYAVCYVVSEEMGVLKKVKKKNEKAKPAWQKRIEGNIREWRKDLGRIEEMRKGIRMNKKKTNNLIRKYDVVEKGCASVSTMLKNKIKASATKLQTFKDKTKQQRQNNLFNSKQSYLYKELNGSSSNGNPSPNADEAKNFWENIWGKEVIHENAEWLEGMEKGFSEDVEKQHNIQIHISDIIRRIRQMNNWKAPGPDGVRGYWFKQLDCLHQPLVEAMQNCLDDGNVPEWMVQGRTVLIQKDPEKGTEASNYRPIACLPLMWKLLSGIFSEKVYNHLLDNHLLPDEQKGCRKASRGTKDQLLIDKQIMKEAKKLKGMWPWHGLIIKRPMTWFHIPGLRQF